MNPLPPKLNECDEKVLCEKKISPSLLGVLVIFVPKPPATGTLGERDGLIATKNFSAR